MLFPATRYRLIEFNRWELPFHPLACGASRVVRPLIGWMLPAMIAGAVVALSSGTSLGQGPDESPSTSAYESGYESEYDDGGYDSEMGTTPAKPAANLTTGPTPMSIFQLIQPDWKPLRQEIARVLAPSATPSTPPITGPQLRNEANVAMRYGNLPLARDLYFGFLARGGEESKEDLNSLKFSNYFRRPVWQIRWGVSLGLHGDTDVTDFAPIKADAAAGMGGMDSGMEMSSDYESDSFNGEGGPGSSSVAELSGSPSSSSSYDDYENMEMDSGSSSQGAPRYDSNGRLISPNAAAAAAPQAQMTDPNISDRFEELMGYVATTVKESMQTRMASGQFGLALANVDLEATDQGDTVEGEYVQPSEPRMWISNVVYLGEGSTQEMSKAAATQGMELLLHFDVGLKEVRNSTPQNSTRVKVIDGRSGRTLITSSEMDNRELQRLLQTKRATAESYVNGALEKFWSVLDSKLSVEPFPKLTPEVARRRVTGVLGDSSFTLLRKLAEIQYMGAQGWLTAEEVEQAYAIAAGSDGMTILYGSPTDAISTVHDIAKRSAVRTP